MHLHLKEQFEDFNFLNDILILLYLFVLTFWRLFELRLSFGIHLYFTKVNFLKVIKKIVFFLSILLLFIRSLLFTFQWSFCGVELISWHYLLHLLPFTCLFLRRAAKCVTENPQVIFMDRYWQLTQGQEDSFAPKDNFRRKCFTVKMLKGFSQKKRTNTKNRPFSLTIKTGFFLIYVWACLRCGFLWEVSLTCS
jgi:hypothetical protein